MKKLKVALCIPAHRQVEAKWAKSLADLIAYSSRATVYHDDQPAQFEFETIVVSSSLLPESRNRLVAEAWKWDADYMLWLDADHVFPCDALLRLLSRSQLVVGCNYARRCTPTYPTASKYGEDDAMDLVWTTEEKAKANELEEVAHVGLGVCLIDMRLYHCLEVAAKEAGRDTIWPLFKMEPKPNGIGFIGEDVHYFKTIRDAGIPVYLDHGVSWEVGHVGETIFTNAHCEVQKPAYEKKIAEKRAAADRLKAEIEKEAAV
jgi:hypothetical protein